jgi:hypothetical protein
VLAPSSPPTAGINSFGSEEVARMMLGSRLIGLLIDNNSETRIVRVGG